MSEELDKAKRQIRALLNLGSDDGATDAEAENALRFARRLMLRHQLSEVDLLTQKPKDPHEIAAETEYGQADHFCHGANLSTWESTLQHAVSKLVGTVKAYITRGQRRTAHGTLVFNKKGEAEYAAKLVFYGPLEDCRAAAELQEEWSVTIAALARLKYGGCFRGAGRSYAEGFAYALMEKMRKIEREEATKIEASKHAGELNAHEQSTALVLVQQTSIMEAKKEAAATWLHDVAKIHLGSAVRRNGNAQDRGAWSAGQADGTKANFQRNATKRIGKGGGA